MEIVLIVLILLALAMFLPAPRTRVPSWLTTILLVVLVVWLISVLL